ncbi:MAG TPA: sigma 54-interacting transcriptional regulator [Pyrinomonadaceae bacterium]|nr:sigma 54-interacting transcriptional regulator [Pyrinomonadaceae bacterium]
MTLNVLSFPRMQREALQVASVRELSEVNQELRVEEDIRSEPTLAGIVGQSSALRQVLQLVEMVAASDATVLLLGETGTGKELIARAIHERSRRQKETFLTLNCAAIPNSLFESELFGHERGAFTGAYMQKLGRLELADRGTLFLDEVGDMPLELQPKLLRALQERAYERVGSARTKSVDVRLVAATNRDLEEMMAEKQFRSDLYYRLNVFPLRIPPLRERRTDIPLLVRHFTQKYASRMRKRIETVPAATIQKLQRWSWPGNVRELENLVERSVILTSGSVLSVPLPEKTNGAIDAAEVVSNFEEQERIVSILKETKGRVSGPNGAASRLGVKRSTLLDRMKKLGIDAREVKSDLMYSQAAAD